jgi:hypothetical protein
LEQLQISVVAKIAEIMIEGFTLDIFAFSEGSFVFSRSAQG